MQGLQQNREQFFALVLVNAFVGSMVGLERAVLPGLSRTLGMDTYSAMLGFLIAFGATKALFNLLTGRLMKVISRRQTLLLGWAAALPVPFLLMYARDWNWVIAANMLLGIHQGLAWSAAVIMKIDLVGEKNRGLAMGINEFAGYLSVGLAAYLATGIAAAKGFGFYPFLPGILFSGAGILLTAFWVKDTRPHVQHEAGNSRVPLRQGLWNETTFRHQNMGSVTLNGFVNNLNDGVIWGLLPALLLERSFSLPQTGLAAATYPAVWGLSQILTGKIGDRWCKKQLITSGMSLQAFGLLLLALAPGFSAVLAAMVVLGLGTALVYPNFLTVVAESTHPTQRAESLSIFRFWRDAGYVAGAVLAGIMADSFGITATFLMVAGLTLAAGLVAEVRMCCTHKVLWSSARCGQEASAPPAL